ncbi:PadR family transcriptional regulator [Mobilitalea sibirica]|uniref:PadR family transcriptional regulator n=1 Tax=Mobilitalea sibirica TaxID=1462919 RepID=A0A8J7HDH9_9FIRM|nr:PadR family transcriptional regulator [Mobilitalea sibirica]MBH1940789.1 PadR family transcriptional regulator [Mobilitalea sibirica]
MSRRNNSYYAILGLLGFEPMSGYGIKTSVDKGVGYWWEIDYKQIYPALKKMEEEELVTSKEEKHGKRPMSKVYDITKAGLEELKKWLIQPIEPGKEWDKELKLKLFFGHHVSVDHIIQHVEKYKEFNVEFLRDIDEIRKSIESEEDTESKYYRMTTVMNGEIMCKANVEWCNQTLKYLKDNMKT